jgi:hypothetical protein
VCSCRWRPAWEDLYGSRDHPRRSIPSGGGSSSTRRLSRPSYGHAGEAVLWLLQRHPRRTATCSKSSTGKTLEVISQPSATAATIASTSRVRRRTVERSKEVGEAGKRARDARPHLRKAQIRIQDRRSYAASSWTSSTGRTSPHSTRTLTATPTRVFLTTMRRALRAERGSTSLRGRSSPR